MEEIEYVYEWVDPNKEVFFPIDTFTLPETIEQFKKWRDQEFEFQKEAIKNSGEKIDYDKCIFKNELILIYQVLYIAC